MTSLLDSLEWSQASPYLVIGLRIVLILVAAWIIGRLLKGAISRTQNRITAVMKSHGDMTHDAVLKRTATMGSILRTTTAVAVWAIALVMSLREAGFDIGPLLAGAGIAGVAVGFGAQSLVRDVITGGFMLVEDQIRVGDVVQINGTGGLVEEINLRTTVLRSLDGTVHIFPNGTIQSVSNMTREFAYYVFDMGVAYKEDTDRVSEAMKEVAEELRADPEFAPLILEPLEILGVDKFADSAVIIKAKIKTLPIKQWAVGRELNRRFKKRFDELGIEIPFPHVTLYAGEASKPLRLESAGFGKEELKQAVREVLSEGGQFPAS